MRPRRNATVSLLCVGLALGLASCATQTTLDTSWHVPQMAGETFHNLAVIGLLKTPELSREFEVAVVNDFEAAGVRGVPGFTVLKGDTTLNQDEMEKLVKGAGADGVLLFKLISIDKSQQYVPPTEYYTSGAPFPGWWSDPYWGYYHPYPYHYWGYWYPAVQVVWAPGYWETEDTDRIETTLYRTSDGKLVWTGTSSTYDPQGNADLAGSISRTVLESLRKEGFVLAR
jgi:hypothetical protein